MSKLYIIKGSFNPEEELEGVDQTPFSTYHTITLNLKTIEGNIEKKGSTNWRISIQNGETRNYHLPTFRKCVDKLKELFHPVDVRCIEVKDISGTKGGTYRIE
ncbi:hypothetical protein [Maribellus mangrovi]|uniref:hypothetical protein n=1 Tax=Maribellus mangrovi TaxID=3133146 RepID=UPI0030ED6C0C